MAAAGGEAPEVGRSRPSSEASAYRENVPGRPGPARRRLAALGEAGRAFLRRHLPNESQHLFALTLAVGVACGLLAVAFHLTIRAAESLLIERALRTENPTWVAWTIASPTLGGLVAGAALYWIVPGARGSGIPQVKQAFATEGGRVRFRDALGKFFVGSLQIGSGASLGREGPTVQICAGAASLLARVTSLPPRNMRRLTPVGVAAGIAAAFNAPIAAVTFTIEEIVGTLDQAVLSGVVVAAAIAAVIERGILGVHPVIEVTRTYGLDHISSLALYGLLGVAAAAVSVAFTEGLLKTRLWFRKLRAVPVWAQPALGGLVTGVLAATLIGGLGVTGVTGGGYEMLGRALDGGLGLRVLAALCAAKIVATVCSYSSGGAGGIFAPTLFIGAMLGGAVGHLDVLVLEHEPQQLGAFALVGMGAVFAGVIRAPLTSVLIIFEMTGNYGLVLPLMLANATSYVLARRLQPTPIYEALLEQDGVLLPRANVPTHPIERLRVSDAMTPNVTSLHPDVPLAEATSLVAGRTFTLAPVIGEGGAVLGAVSVADLRNASPGASIAALVRKAHHIRSDAPLLRAVVRMHDLGARQLLVVDAESGTRLVGMLAMSDVVRAHARAAPPSNAWPTGAARPELAPELRADALMMPATLVPSNAKVTELTGRSRDGTTRIFVVRGDGGQFGALLPDQLNEFARNEDLEKLLVAADLAHAAPSVDPDADLPTLLGAMQSEASEAAVVLDVETREPIGVVTRSALAQAFLDRYAGRPLPASDRLPKTLVADRALARGR